MSSVAKINMLCKLYLMCTFNVGKLLQRVFWLFCLEKYNIVALCLRLSLKKRLITYKTCYAVLSVPCSLLIACGEKLTSLALLCVVFSCVLVTFS